MLASRKAQAIERAPISAAVMRAPAHIVGIVSHSEPTFVRTCGCHPNVGVVYVNVGDMVKPVAVHQLLLNGATPLLELLPYRVPLSEIIAGKHDDWFRAYAQMVKRQQAEVLMSFEPEADGNWYDWASTTTSHRTSPSAVIRPRWTSISRACCLTCARSPRAPGTDQPRGEPSSI